MTHMIQEQLNTIIFIREALTTQADQAYHMAHALGVVGLTGAHTCIYNSAKTMEEVAGALQKLSGELVSDSVRKAEESHQGLIEVALANNFPEQEKQDARSYHASV